MRALLLGALLTTVAPWSPDIPKHATFVAMWTECAGPADQLSLPGSGCARRAREFADRAALDTWLRSETSPSWGDFRIYSVGKEYRMKVTPSIEAAQ